MTELPETRDAYALLSKPTLKLTDDEVEVIVADLRKRRQAFLAGQADKPARKSAARPKEVSAEEKKQLTEQVAAQISLEGLL